MTGFFPSKKNRQGSHLELTIADINSSTITSIFTYSEAERATGQVNELHSSPKERWIHIENYKIQRSKKKTKLLVELWKNMTPLEEYDIQLWHVESLRWPQLTHSSCWTQSPASQGQQYIVSSCVILKRWKLISCLSQYLQQLKIVCCWLLVMLVISI